MIQIRGVRKSYGTQLVLDDVNVELPAGGIIALVGSNGAGKSTLLSVIARLLEADAGTVTVGGFDVTTTHPGQIARTLSVLKQDNHLSVRLTVRDLVAFGRFPHSHGRHSEADERIVDEAISWMDMEDLSERYLDEMSGGQRQRAFVAMVLAQQTPYVLLDEPLNNLDMVHSVSMMRRLRAAADDLGRTIVVVMHDINMAAAWADHIVAMRDGKLVSQGSPEQIMTQECLSEVFGIQVPVHTVDGSRIAMVWGQESMAGV